MGGHAVSDLTPEELAVLRKTLGAEYGPRHTSTNYLVAPALGPTRAACTRLASAGLMRPGRPASANGRFFHATEAGARAIGESLAR